MNRMILPALLAAGALANLATPAHAQAKKSDAVVKVTAEAGPVGSDGKQVVVINLAVEKGWHIYANPVGQKDLEDVQTAVSVKSPTAAKDVKIAYPTGKLEKDAIVGDYNVYEDKVVIKAHVQRAPGDTSPLEVSVKVQACNKTTCLLPATVKLTVK
jgi:DsbC/DsbD-like thiol-disulfide interchange protein